MFTLIEITNKDENSLKLSYLFVKEASANDWKKRYQLSCILKNIPIIKQGNLSDFEYFKVTKKQKASFESANKEYLLLLNGNPVSCIYTIQKVENIIDITVTTLPKYRKKGYAKKGVQLAEEKIFANPNVFFTTITDITKEKICAIEMSGQVGGNISSKIAIALGYAYHEETNTFIKANPILEENITHLM